MSRSTRLPLLPTQPLVPSLTPDEHFARASGEARLALIWEKLKEIQEAIGELTTP